MKAFYILLLAVVMTGCGSEDAPEAAPAQETQAVESALIAPLNANLASEEELASAPGVGAALATAIVAGRPYLDAVSLHHAVMAAGTTDTEPVFRSVFVPINLNTASREEILLVPGVGDRMAHEFEEYRPYVAMAQFKREMAKYVDDTEVERLSMFVFVPIDINTATEEEILAIPGVGARMKHEFEEYRPYVSMEQFNREIGKYVDAAELARLARYVEIRN